MSASASSTRRRPDANDGMVVDDEDANGQDDGTSATTVVPAPGVDSTCSRPPARDTRSRIPARPSASARVAVGSKPDPSSSTTATTALFFRCRRMLTRLGAGVLDHVGQRLLDHAVERRLRLARQPSLRRAATPDRLAGHSVRGTCRSSARQPGTSPKSSRAAGRSSTASRRTSCSVEMTSSRTDVEGFSSLRGVSRLLQRLQPEQDRRQRLTGLVVQLARKPRSLELLRLDHPADRVAADPLGEVDGDRRPGPRATPPAAGRPR